MQQRAMLGLAAAMLCAPVAAALAADPVAQDKIVGSDVMGGKSRNGPDGGAWAPVTRDQTATSAAQGRAGTGAPNTMPSTGAGKALPPGQDPGTPMATNGSGTGPGDSPAVTRTP